MQSAQWLADTLGGKGSIVAINGVSGHPANQMRVEGYQEVFSKYPDIKILNEANANWDQAQGQQTRSEEHTSELQSLMRISYAVFCLTKKKQTHDTSKKEQH